MNVIVPEHPGSTLRLADHGRACVLSDQVVLLDLRRSKYLSIGLAHWERLTGDTRGNDDARLIDPLWRQGLLTRAPAQHHLHAVPPLPQATGSLDVQGAMPCSEVGAGRTLRIAGATAWAAAALRLRSLHHVANRVARRAVPPSGPRTHDEARLHDAVAAFVAPEGPPAIAFHDVHLAYRDDRPVLRGFSLDVPAGTTVAIVGASGAGKSSIARLLLRLLDASSGHVLWDGVDTRHIDVATLRRRIGVVPQDPTLLNDTIAANIAIGRPGASRAEIEEAARRAQLHTFVESLPEGYATSVGERGLKLSGGERQRIAIARAVLRRPQVYVFDEISSMLDGPTEAALLRNLREICAGCTTIFITHRLAAARLADQIVVLDDGKVAEHGSHEELLALGGRYAKTWRSPSRDAGTA